MPIEIFISYRRSDTAGHARALHRALKEFFDLDRMFFDRETIESGDKFPDLISNSVRDCHVLLALIAPDWLKAEHGGKRRLDDANDFVRQEIALALSTGKKVIPVLFDDTPVPGRGDLPDVLGALAECDILRLTGKNYEYETQLRELVRLVASVPGVSPARPQSLRARGAVSAEPRKLACLCDRSLQDKGMGDAIREQLPLDRGRRPFVVVVHGRVEELHYAFVERLEEFSLPRLLKGACAAPEIKLVDIFDALPVDPGQPSFDRRLREKLAEQLEMNPFDDDCVLADLLPAQRLAALIVVVRWRSSEVMKDPQAPLQRLFDYWSRFPDIGGRVLVGCIACMKYDTRDRGAGWLKRIFSRGSDHAEPLRAAVLATASSYRQESRVMWRVLPELPSITVGDLGRWVEEVEKIISRSLRIPELRLQAIIGDRPHQPMEKVLPELEDLITQH